MHFVPSLKSEIKPIYDPTPVEITLEICTVSTRGQQSDGDNKATLASILRAPVTENTEMLGEYVGEELGYKTKSVNSLGSY